MKLSTNCMNFSEPSSLLSYFEDSCQDSTIGNNVDEVIDGHYFNSKVNFILPGASSIPPSCQRILDDCIYYKVLNVPIQEFCRSEFNLAFVQCGKFYGTSANSRLDLDNSCAFFPSGLLVLSLNRFDYHSLGLSGKPSSDVLRKPNHRYIVEIDTSHPAFVAKKAEYQKVQKAFSQCPILFDLHIAWDPYDKNTCPSSIAKYFSDLGYSTTEEQPSRTNETLSNLHVPLFSNLTESNHDLEEALEWIGQTSLGIKVDCARSDEDYVDKPVVPEPSTPVSFLEISHATGFFTLSTIRQLVKEMRTWLTSGADKIPWVILTVYGSPDALVSWGRNENHFRFCGDNFYTLILHRDRTDVFKLEGSSKPLRFYRKTSNKK